MLKFKNFKFRAGKCEKQKDGFDCGKHVIKNARAQVRLLSGVDPSVSSVELNSIRVTPPEKTKHANKNLSINHKNVIKPKLLEVGVGVSHIRDLGGALKSLLCCGVFVY